MAYTPTDTQSGTYRDPNDPIGGAMINNPQSQLGLTSPPPPVASPDVAQNTGSPVSPQQQLGLGSNAPDYNTLKQNATNAYLANGGTQANVDAYFAANPNQDYGRLASDAAQWYTGPERNTPQPPLTSGQSQPGPWDPSMPDYQAEQQRLRDIANQQVSSYFGISAPAAGTNLNFAPPGPVTPQAGQYNYPQSWINTVNSLDPATQAAIRARYSGMSPDQIMADWNANVASRYPPGTDPMAILNGTTQPGPNIPGPQGPQGPAGPAGSISRAMQSSQTAAPQDTAGNLARKAAEEAAFGAGSGTIYDPWNQNPTQGGNPMPQQGQTMGAPSTETFGGRTFQRPGQLTQWDQPGGPGPSYTVQGQQQLAQPFSMGGQQFGGLQSLLDYMATSTPGQQGIKRQMEQRDAQGGSLESGEANLFDQFARYLGQNVSQPPTGATPFTNWDPVGLLKLLQTAGLFGPGAPAPAPGGMGTDPTMHAPFPGSGGGPAAGTGVAGGVGSGGGTGGSSGDQPWQPGGPAGGWGPAPHAPYAPGPYGPAPGTGVAGGGGTGGGRGRFGRP